jgi:hypothetical protein
MWRKLCCLIIDFFCDIGHIKGQFLMLILSIMTDQKYITELHNDHKMWLSQLMLAQDQIRSFNLRLEDLVKANTGSDILAHVEKFQNQFIRENEVIDHLAHDIRGHEKEISGNAASNTVAVDHRMLTFQHIYNDLRTDFIAFVAKYL